MSLAAYKGSLKDSRDAVLMQFDAPVHDLDKSYAPGKWTVHEILIHLADCEAVFLWRIMRAIAESGSTVEGFDQDKWAAKLDYVQRPLKSARALFVATRDLVIEHLGHVDDDALRNNSVMHTEAGSMTLGQLLERYDKHTWHHLAQIEAARTGKIWQPTS